MIRFSRFASLLLFTLFGLLCIALPLNAAEPPATVESARRFMQLEQWDAANFEWRRVLEADPANVDATIGLAVCLLKSGLTEDSIALIETLPSAKRSVPADLTLARAYTTLNDWTKAREIYSQVLLKMPFQIDAFRELNTNREHFSGAARQSLDNDLTIVAKAAQDQAEAMVKNRNYAQALPLYEIASSGLKTVGLVNDYGMLLLLHGQYEKAHAQFAFLKSKDQLKFSEVDSNAAIASLSIGNLAEAKAEIQESISACVDKTVKARLYNNMGYIYEMARRRADARFAYEHAVELDPTLTIAQLNLAYVQQADRDFKGAIINYKAVLRREPNRADVWTRLGFVYELQYRARSAVEAYKQAIAANPSDKENYYNLATLYKKMHKMREANEALKKVAEMNYQEIEAGKTNKPPVVQTNKILKYVVLFPSNPHILEAMQ